MKFTVKDNMALYHGGGGGSLSNQYESFNRNGWYFWQCFTVRSSKCHINLCKTFFPLKYIKRINEVTFENKGKNH